MLNHSADIVANETLQFDVKSLDGSQSNTTEHTVTLEEINKGGIFNFNITVQAVEKPDFVITEKWVCWPDNCTICYNVTNIGNGTAPAGHNTSLYVDGAEVACDCVSEDLMAGKIYTGCFNGYKWSYTPTEDNVTICADCNNTIAESNEINNCMINTWMCGDVNEDGTINVLDVLGVYRRALDLNYELDCRCEVQG